MRKPRQTVTALYVAAGVVLFVAIVLAVYNLGVRRGGPPANGEAGNAALGTTALPPEGETPGANALAADNAGAAGGETDGTEGREEAAMAAAIEWKPDWSFRVDGHAKDWSEVNVYAGKEEGKWTAILRFIWDNDRYVYEGQEPFPGAEQPKPKKPAAKPKPAPQEQPLTEDDLKGIPKEFRPGDSTAREAALAGHEEWVAKVNSHSKDWSSAVVWIGPPESEYVWAVHLKWNRSGGYYDVTKSEEIGGGE